MKDRNYNLNYVDPSNLFSGLGYMQGPQYHDLNEAFANARYMKNENGDVIFNNKYPMSHNRNPADMYGRNAGAIEILPSLNNPNKQPIREYGLSRPDIIANNSKSHSERIVFLNALDKLINSQYPNNGEIRSPLDPYFKKPNDKTPNHTIATGLNQLANNASDYQKLLQHNKHKVNLWTERAPCGPGSKSGCTNFLNNIMPIFNDNDEKEVRGNVGYISKDYDPPVVEAASTKLKTAYKNYEPLKIFNINNSSKASDYSYSPGYDSGYSSSDYSYSPGYDSDGLPTPNHIMWDMNYNNTPDYFEYSPRTR